MDPKLIGLIAVLGAETGVVAVLLLVLVDGFGLAFFDYLTGDFSFADGEGDFGKAGTGGKRKAIDRFEVFWVGVKKRLGHFGLGEAIVQRDFDVVINDSNRFVRGAFGGEDTSCLNGGA